MLIIVQDELSFTFFLKNLIKKIYKNIEYFDKHRIYFIFKTILIALTCFPFFLHRKSR